MRLTTQILLAATALTSAGAAFAQTAPTAGQAGGGTLGAAPVAQPAADPGEQIIVTGSRIARPNLDSAVPITSAHRR